MAIFFLPWKPTWNDKEKCFCFSAFELMISWEQRKLLTKNYKNWPQKCNFFASKNVEKIIFQVFNFQLWINSFDRNQLNGIFWRINLLSFKFLSVTKNNKDIGSKSVMYKFKGSNSKKKIPNFRRLVKVTRARKKLKLH